MQRDNVDDALSTLAFEFFYAFARFEFALKENGYLKDRKSGAIALPGWNAFVNAFKKGYRPSREAVEILTALPEQQVVGHGSQLTWRAVELSHSKSDLESVVKLLKTIRNNLFHGGKNSAAGWDNAARTRLLLECGIAVLPQLAALDSTIEADYLRRY